MKTEDLLLYGGAAAAVYFFFIKPKTASNAIPLAPVQSANYLTAAKPPVNVTSQLLTAGASLVPQLTKFFMPTPSNAAQQAAVQNATYVPVVPNASVDTSSLYSTSSPAADMTAYTAPVPPPTDAELMYQEYYGGDSMAGISNKMAACIGLY